MLHQLTDPEYLEHLLQKNAITPSHSAGQNFLICEEPIEAMLTALEGSATSMTELGAGLGPLTHALLASGYTVRAIERDEKLSRILERGLGTKYPKQLDVVTGDLRQCAWEWDTPWQLVGNIPYNLSGYIFRHLTALASPPTQAVFMVQKEVGERLMAEAGQMNLLGLAAHLWGSVHLLLNVPKTCFLPSPEVDSVVVLLVPHKSVLPLPEREHIMAIASVFFQHKRKQMSGVLKRVFNLTAEDADRILRELGSAATARPQELSVAQWIALASLLPHVAARP